MSVKAMSLVWDLDCPARLGQKEFKPSHKYVLIAYADHADHNGKNIYPAVATIARKTGLDDRTVQRLTHDLKEMGLLVEDGEGPRGTNRWALPYSKGGDKLTPLSNCQGDESEKSLGDIPSGDIPSGDKLTPELKEPEQEIINYISNDVVNVWETLKGKLRSEFKKAQFDTWIEPTVAVAFENKTIIVTARNNYARTWLDENVRTPAQVELGVYVNFTVAEVEEEN